ncbi:MAG: 50S ribosomal protein L20 [bacterium]
MPRVKKGLNALKKRKKLLKQVKGYRFGRGTKAKQATEAILHAGKYAFAHRRKKKRTMRKLFQEKIGATSKENGTSYSKLMGDMKKKNIALNRKVLADMAEKSPATFVRIVEKCK